MLTSTLSEKRRQLPMGIIWSRQSSAVELTPVPSTPPPLSSKDKCSYSYRGSEEALTSDSTNISSWSEEAAMCGSTNWCKRRMMEELDLEYELEMACQKPEYATYGTGLSAEELKKVLDFHQCDPHHANLPDRQGMGLEIKRWLKTKTRRQVRDARSTLEFGDDKALVGLLASCLDHTVRKWVEKKVKRYHRFGLSFDYQGLYPSAVYYETMSREALRAMLEFRANPKITLSQIKSRLEEYSGRRLKKGLKKGYTRDTYLSKLREKEKNGAKKKGRYNGFTYVPCWIDQVTSLQAKYDAEKEMWQAEMNEADAEELAAISTKGKRKGKMTGSSALPTKPKTTKRQKLVIQQ
eukprot:scaffold69310_cov48-Attheya_sp.AAC.5